MLMATMEEKDTDFDVKVFRAGVDVGDADCKRATYFELGLIRSSNDSPQL